MNFTRLTLIPTTPDENFRLVDIPEDTLVLDNGVFKYPAEAKSLTLVSIPIEYQYTPFNNLQQIHTLINSSPLQEVKIVNKQEVTSELYPDTDTITASDPTSGTCICGITCTGTRITFAKIVSLT